MTNTCLELAWLRYILQDLKVELHKSTSLFCDNQAGLYIATSPFFHERTKHIEINCHIVREKLQASEIHPCSGNTFLQKRLAESTLNFYAASWEFLICTLQLQGSIKEYISYHMMLLVII